MDQAEALQQNEWKLLVLCNSNIELLALISCHLLIKGGENTWKLVLIISEEILKIKNILVATVVSENLYDFNGCWF